MVTDQTYITKEGLESIKEELKVLTTTKRNEISERIAQAKELGDLSENADYDSAKEAFAFNEGRVMELEAVLKYAVIIEEENRQPGVVSVGSQITIKEAEGNKTREYHIVGSHEANPSNGKISNESPVGTALLDKKKGDKVKAHVPAGVIEYEITKLD